MFVATEGLNVIAYATYCQRDQRGRPVAGYINICPQMLMDQNYDEEKVYWVRIYFVLALMLTAPLLRSVDHIIFIYMFLLVFTHITNVYRQFCVFVCMDILLAPYCK